MSRAVANTLLPAARPASRIARPRSRELPVTNHICAIHPPLSSHRPDILEKLLKLRIGCAMGIARLHRAALMAHSQVLNFADTFSATITTAACRTKPSWMVVAGNDRTINPDLERWYAKRANSHTVEVAGASHSVYVSHPKEVADVIESAARAVWK